MFLAAPFVVWLVVFIWTYDDQDRLRPLVRWIRRLEVALYVIGFPFGVIGIAESQRVAREIGVLVLAASGAFGLMHRWARKEVYPQEKESSDEWWPAPKTE